jgi:hypothetical protein
MLAGFAIEAVRGYAEAQMLMVPPPEAARITHQWLDEFSRLPCRKAEDLGRTLYAGPDDRRREDYWRETQAHLGEAAATVERTAQWAEPPRLEFEVVGKDLVAAAAGQSSSVSSA